MAWMENSLKSTIVIEVEDSVSSCKHRAWTRQQSAECDLWLQSDVTQLQCHGGCSAAVQVRCTWSAVSRPCSTLPRHCSTLRGCLLHAAPCTPRTPSSRHREQRRGARAAARASAPRRAAPPRCPRSGAGGGRLPAKTAL